MTEAEWLSCADPQKMFTVLRGRASERKLVLLATAWCRRAWDLLTPGNSKEAVEVAERFAEGQAPEEDRWRSRERAFSAFKGVIRHNRHMAIRDGRIDRKRGAITTAAHAAAWCVREGGWRAVWAVSGLSAVASAVQNNTKRRQEEAANAETVRCVFGNPFRPVSLSPAWLTANLLALAHAAYDH